MTCFARKFANYKAERTHAYATTSGMTGFDSV